MFACICVCSPPMHAYYPHKSEAGTRFPGTGATMCAGDKVLLKSSGLLNCCTISPAPKGDSN